MVCSGIIGKEKARHSLDAPFFISFEIGLFFLLLPFRFSALQGEVNASCKCDYDKETKHK